MNKRLNRQREMRRRRGWYRFFRALTIMIFFGAALCLGLVAGLFAAVSKMLPRGEALADIRPPSPTRILAVDGTLLARINLPDENREIVPLERIGDNMKNATIAIEDIRFYDHPGVDPKGIIRAAVKNLLAGNSKEGASTITQQLARNLYLTREKSITRKLREILLALELERRYSKAEILETYLNQSYYGSNSYGVQSCGVQMAARNYFGKNVQDLSLAESALLAGLPKNPRDYNPYRFPKAALNRRNQVLYNMLHYNLISRQDYDEAVKEPIKLIKEKKVEELADSHAPYFVRYVLVNELKRIFGLNASDYIYNYGIDVYTTLDPRMQKVAEETVSTQVEKNKFRHIDDGALIAIDPQTGFIKAMVGGTNFRRDQYNIVTQGHRQPGSAFKPFDYTTAMIHGYTPDTTVFDISRTFPGGAGQPWTPKNSDGHYLGAIPLKKALWLSRNCAAAGVAYDVGIRNIIDIAHRMGIKYQLEPVLSTALGASVVVPMEICSAYGTLANHGIHHPPTAVARVTTPEGEVIYDYSPQPERVIPMQIADTMKITMRGTIERGTGRAARCPFPASGKTGTTNSYRDAWFIGYTDDLVAAVWVGNRHNQPMNRTFGATVPAPIWKQFMLVAQPIMAAEHNDNSDRLLAANNLPDCTDLDTSPTPYIMKIRGNELQKEAGKENQPTAATTEPEPAPVPGAGQEYTVPLCLETGDRATQWCPQKVMVTYVKGRQPEPPTGYCKLHTGPEAVPTVRGENDRGTTPRKGERGILISVCAETGKIATDKCPTVLLRRFISNPPTETCPLHGGD